MAHRVVVVGAGFGGLPCVRRLRGGPVEVTLVDRRNYHLFTPLLYQVASCLLNPSEIAAPLRKVLHGAPDVRFRLGEVTGVDLGERLVHLADGAALPYDDLVLSIGSTTNYFGNDAIASRALGLKDLGEALRLRNHVLRVLERAATTSDPDARRALLTFCIVGGGPTGVEYAGALAELVRLVLPREYPELDRGEVRIVLLEGADRVLSMFPASLSAYAARQLRRMGVDVRLDRLVASATESSVTTRDGEVIPTETFVWTAGVEPSPLAAGFGLPLDARGRVEVDEHLRVRGVPHVYAIGDVAAARDRRGGELPMVSPPAMQAGRYVARAILAGIDGRPTRRFRYVDKGTLATIGRQSAVGTVGRLRFRGFVGWVVWLAVHLWYLIGFENRVRVLLRWAWYYVRLDRPVRAIIRSAPDHSAR